MVLNAYSLYSANEPAPSENIISKVTLK
jgi:hypothetical protein